MAKKLNLGIIGMSEGNGHPYSWSAIFNGYDKELMNSCPFPVIPKYLERQEFPNDFLNERASVTHIWTQDIKVSTHVAKCSKITKVSDSLDELIAGVDAVLLARDDAENHAQYAIPVLQAGLPIYIDKPFALNRDAAHFLWNSCQFKNQIFTCSALQFAQEFQSERLDYNRIGDPLMVWATVGKSWDKYAVHIIEPVLKMFPDRGTIQNIVNLPNADMRKSTLTVVFWSSGLVTNFQTCGDVTVPLSIRVAGSAGYQDLYFKDSYGAFKNALERFIDVISESAVNIEREFTLQMVEILEKGRNE
jgi:hypothetical protein